MRSANSFAAKVTSWELLATNLLPHLTGMPHLQNFYEQMLVLILEARRLDGQQESARAQARELTHQRQEVEREGENMRARVAAHLRATFGFTSEQLVQFGINPRRHSSRRREPSLPLPE